MNLAAMGGCKAYEQQVDGLLRVLKSNKIAVYWVELPPMGAPEQDAAAKRIAAIHKARVQAAGVRFVEIRRAFANEDGTYTDKGTDVGGTFRRLRARNGIHFLKSGNTKLAKLAIDAVNLDIEVSDGLREPDPQLAADVDPAELDGKPLFGYSLSTGEPVTLDPAELPKIDAITIARAPVRQRTTAETSGPISGEIIIKSLRDTAIPGSDASRLFTDGEWPAVPEGRIDDFSWPVQ